VTVYLLFPLAVLIFAVSRGATVKLRAKGEKRVLEIIASNVSEVALIFAAVSGVYSLASFVIVSIIGSSDATLSRVHRFDEFLKHSREFWEHLELSTWWFILFLLLLAPLGSLRVPNPKTGGNRLLSWFGSLAMRLSTALRGYRKLHKRLVIALVFAVSFTFLPGMNAGDIERLTSARLEQAGKQLAEIDHQYQQLVATVLADAIVDRAAAALPPDYQASIKNLPDRARYLDEYIEGLEEVYKISLEPLHRKVAPYIGRFQKGESNKVHTDPYPREDPSHRLLAEVFASGSQITFGDVERVSAQVHDTKPASKDRVWDDVPKEVVEEVTSELLKPARLGLVAIKSGLASMKEEYPWLEPLLEVGSDSVAKIVAEKPFAAAWRHLARLFEGKASAAAQPVDATVEIRVAELSVLIVADAGVLDAHARGVLEVVMSDGRALDALSREAQEELKRAYAALVASNNFRIKEIYSRYPLYQPRSAGSTDAPGVQHPNDDLDAAIDPIASRILGTLSIIETPGATPWETRDRLDALEDVLPSADLDKITEVQRKISGASEYREKSSLGRGSPLGERGPRGLGDRLIEDRMRDAIEGSRRPRP
jgi:hypothetical protein